MTASVRPFQAGDLPAIRRVMEASLAVDAIPGFLANDIERAMIRIEPDPEGTVVGRRGRRGRRVLHPEP